MSTVIGSADRATRIEDYLSDKIQTSADLHGVGQLLARVREQQTLLENQLSAARTQLSEVQSKSDGLVDALKQRTTTYQRTQADIDLRLRILTQSEVSDEATKVLEGRMSKLHRLETATSYVELLQEIDRLTTESHNILQQDLPTAIGNHTRLRTLLLELHSAQPAAEGAAPHLLNHAEQNVQTLYAELELSLETSLRKTLDMMAWPKKELKLADHLVQRWREDVDHLLDLQEIFLLQEPLDRSMSASPTAPVLLPLKVMVHPIALRFQYHFYGERPTNRLDKPEYFFSHALDLIDQHSPFMTQLFQPVLDHRLQKLEKLETVYPDAVSAFTTALLPMLSAKCQSLLPQISSQPQLLSHFIHEMMSFDSTLRDSWAYTPIPGSFADWKGLTSEMLDTHGYFSTWLDTEKSFALSRYKSIRDAEDANQIDYEGVEEWRTKPTNSAVRVNDLLETITDRYRPLLSFSQKMKFLMDVQLAIFDDYHGYLHGALQAHLASSHTAGRLIQGQAADDTLGLKGLESLAKISGSAEYLERKMSDWNDDLFFLELWDELQDRARRNTRADGTVGKGLHIDEVANKTSATIKAADDDEQSGGGLFDESASSYRNLRERAENEIIRVFEINVRSAMRSYTRVPTWSSMLSAPPDPSSLTPSAALDPLLSTVSTLFNFLSKIFAPAPLRRMTRHVCGTIQKEIYDNVVMRNTFSTAGASQIHRDLVAIRETIDNSSKQPGEAGRGMRKLEEALFLLNLPIKPSSKRHSAKEDDEWGFDDEQDIDEPTEESAKAQTPQSPEVDSDHGDQSGSDWGLWDAEREVFASNESARKALSEMKLYLLSESEARNLISKRVEINS